jgi:hypothetical protein
VSSSVSEPRASHLFQGHIDWDKKSRFGTTLTFLKIAYAKHLINALVLEALGDEAYVRVGLLHCSGPCSERGGKDLFKDADIKTLIIQ